MKIKKKKHSVLVAALVAIATALLIGWFFFYRDDNPRTAENGIDYSPATKDDKSFNDRIKQELPSESDLNQPQPSQLRAVKPAISAWGQPNGPGTDFQLNGFIDGIIESDGECTLSLEKNGKTVIVTKNSLQNAQSTSCGQMTVLYTKLTPGTWTATLTYKSPTSQGSSDTVMIEVR